MTRSRKSVAKLFRGKPTRSTSSGSGIPVREGFPEADVEQNPFREELLRRSEAVKWYRMAAEQGHIVAQMRLGYMYANDEGDVKDDAEAVRWFRMAADQGNAFAQSIASVSCTYNGEVVPENGADAVKWYRLSADQGFYMGQYALGVMYNYCEGVPKHYVVHLVVPVKQTVTYRASFGHVEFFQEYRKPHLRLDRIRSEHHRQRLRL